jgi:hypothetical protein
MKFQYAVGIGALACGLVGVPGVAQTTAKQDVKEAAKATGRAAKKTGKKMKRGTKKAVNQAAKETEKGAKTIAKKTDPNKR